jgi:hypothetical protein
MVASRASPSPNPSGSSTPPPSARRLHWHSPAGEKIYDTCLRKFSAVAYRDQVLRPLRLSFTLIIALALAASACGSAGDDSSNNSKAEEADTTSTVADDNDSGETDLDLEVITTTTAPVVVDTPTTAPPTGDQPTGTLAEGSVTTADGLRADWELTATATTLCFRADLSHPDPASNEEAGTGVEACLDPDGGLDQMESGLSVDVGVVDGDRSIGFLWGRVAPEVISLTIEHTNGSQTPLEILPGSTRVQVFAYVVEIAAIAEVQDLDAVSGTQIEGSEPIRGFLRAGPTYPVVAPLPVTPPPDYPVT